MLNILLNIVESRDQGKERGSTMS